MQIASYPYGVDAEARPDIAERILHSTLLPGKPAPPLTGNDGKAINPDENDKPVIVFFYESRCRSCRTMIDAMIARYGELQEAGIRVITLSSDRDRALHEDYSRKFPWPDKLCDFRYYDSPNFVNYGVASTPATFLIVKGKVEGQYGSPDEIMDVLLKYGQDRG
jgi:peroxiredoxin